MHHRIPLAILAALSLASCTAPLPKEGALPEGIESVRVPPVDASAFIYVSPPQAAPFSSPHLAIEDLTVDSIEVLLADDSNDKFAHFALAGNDVPFNPPPETGERWVVSADSSIAVGPRTEWGGATLNAWNEQDLVRIQNRFSDAWEDLVKAPGDPPATPIAAGFVRNFGPLIEDLVERAGTGVPGLTSDLALLRIDSVSFVAYADNFDRIPESVGPGVLRDRGLSVLAIAHSSYPGFIVGWIFNRFAGGLDLAVLHIDGVPVRYRQVAADEHVMVLRDGSTLFFATAATRPAAEALATAVIHSTLGVTHDPTPTPAP